MVFFQKCLIFNKHAPLKIFGIKNRYSPWFSNDLAELIHRKNALWRKAHSTQSLVDWLAFCQRRNKATQANKTAKIIHFHNHFVYATQTVSKSNPDPVLTDILDMTSADLQPPLNNSGFSFTPLSTLEVQDEVTKLNTNKSAGLDGPDPISLKAAAGIIAAPITRLFNMSLQFSEFPSDWKSAIIFPLFKGGSGFDPNCYCPISILPLLAKVLEKLVQN